MPAAWTLKDELQYQHIRQSGRGRGLPEARAEEIAARTVNKHRREEGRTPNASTQGVGNPCTSLDERTKDDLYNLAKELKIEGRSQMTKDELMEAIRAVR